MNHTDNANTNYGDYEGNDHDDDKGSTYANYYMRVLSTTCKRGATKWLSGTASSPHIICILGSSRASRDMVDDRRKLPGRVPGQWGGFALSFLISATALDGSGDIHTAYRRTNVGDRNATSVLLSGAENV